MPDAFSSFASLAAAMIKGVDYSINWQGRDSRVLVIAPHGGTIEPGTSELAEAVAAGDLALYRFEGLRADAFATLHLTSTRFDEPLALAMVARADTVIALHGLAGPGRAILVGGRNDELADGIVAELVAAGIAARRATDGHYAGVQPENICNRGRMGRGVQLEIERGLRDELRHQPDAKANLAAAIRRAIGSLP